MNGTPPTAMLNVVTSIVGNLKLISPGQVIADTTTPGCIASGTTVVAVWPARGIVYMSAPALCSNSTDTFTFTDNTFNPGVHCTTADGGSLDQQSGCLYIDAAFRTGDGVYANNVGGISAVNCIVFEHQVSFHLDTGANGSRWSDCATGDNISLPQGNIADVTNSIISILINGQHHPYDPGDAANNDACDNSWANSILGQHRPVVLVVQSNCPAANMAAVIPA